MKRLLVAIPAVAVLLGGCTTDSLRTALGSPKNPTPVFSEPKPIKGRGPSQDAFIEPLYRTLLEANQDSIKNRAAATEPMRRYLAAGFALSDIYCARFFVKTDEAYRRRRFGRALTNDVGTAVSTVLGLAHAGESVVTGVAAAVGLADSGWRNYDDSFVISPDLSGVQALVFAAQDNLRSRALGRSATLPADYATAQSVILRYANICSFLGMKALLDQSAGQQRRELNDQTEATNRALTPSAKGESGVAAKGAATAAGPVSAAKAGSLLPTASPTLAPNQDSLTPNHAAPR